jgi:hypothetical protein
LAQYYVRIGRKSRNIRKQGRGIRDKSAKEGTMAGAYDDRDGWIWMDGKLVDWRQANVHILTHAMHYASSVFEGERAYNGRIFESRGGIRSGCLSSGRMLDFRSPTPSMRSRPRNTRC